jgi:hypothetical protein
MIQAFLARHVAFGQYYAEGGLYVPVVVNNFVCGFEPVLNDFVGRHCDQTTQLSAVNLKGSWL